MSDSLDVDIVLEDLRRELRIAPSPHFEHRVRAYVFDRARSGSPIARKTRRVGARQSLILLGLSVSVVAAGLLLLAQTPSVAELGSELPRIAATPRAAATIGALAVPTELPPFAGAVAPARSKDRDFEVIVPPDQLEALTRLLETMRQRRMAWTPGPSVPGAAEPLVDVEPIEIPPIKIEPLPALLPAPGERKQP